MLRVYGEHALAQPDAAKTMAVFARVPAGIGAPAELVGRPALTAVQAWAGSDLAAAERAFAPLLAAAPAALHWLAPMPFLELQRMDDAVSGPGKCNYTKGGYLGEISDGVIAALEEGGAGLLGEETIIEVIPHGGAQLRLGEDDTAFPDRAAPFSYNVYSRWPAGEDDAPHVAWTREAFARLDRHAIGGVYTNFFAVDEGQDRVRVAYGDAKYARLAQVKRRYDPENVFSLNGNILPAGG